MIRLAIFKTLYAITFITTVACAENPAPAVAPVPTNGGIEEVTSETKLELDALYFKGRDAFGRQCNLLLAGYEPQGHGHDHSMQWVAQLEYVVHGVRPLDMQLDFYRYSIDTNQFFSAIDEVVDTYPVLAGAILSDKTLEADINQLPVYEQQLSLLQSMRIDFFDMDILQFEQAMDEVLHGASLSDYLAVLNQMNRAVLKVKHSDHYDAGVCSDFRLQSDLVKAEFNLNSGHQDDHDHDHDDHDDHGDHDHDHDHDDHDDDHGDHDHDHGHDH
jgi:hypothetical protein